MSFMTNTHKGLDALDLMSGDPPSHHHPSRRNQMNNEGYVETNFYVARTRNFHLKGAEVWALGLCTACNISGPVSLKSEFSRLVPIWRLAMKRENLRALNRNDKTSRLQSSGIPKE